MRNVGHRPPCSASKILIFTAKMAVETVKLALTQLTSMVPGAGFEGILRPTTSNDTGRYERTGFAEPVNMQISSGLFIRSRVPEPTYLPLHWSAYIHPEGQLYFCREGPSLRVVTEAYLYRPETLDKATRWIKRIEDLIAEKEFPASHHLELFIKLEDEDCAYYLIDHVTHAASWLETIDTDDLGLPPVVSLSQLNILCEELYWIHLEHFPMHGGISSDTLNSLICVFTHAICDQMTSRVSTFPYTKQECEGFVSLLRNSRDHLSDGNIVCTVARLWGLICRNRYLTQYGQEHSRLSRDQAVLWDPETKNPWVSTVASRISFTTSDRYLAQLDDVFVDHLVYLEQWKSMVTGCLRDWRRASLGAFLALMLHILLLALTPSLSLAVASASLFGASLLGSTLLIHRYTSLQGIDAGQAMDYLEAIQSPTFKFQFVALMFALPHTLNLWGYLVLLANCIFMLAVRFGTGFAAGISLVALLAFLAFQWTTSETFNLSLTRIHDKFRAKFSRNQDTSYASVV
ncbi:hypothetical protein DFH08DRAFT_845389 [Mycena albidolilacea]|uniref:Uncharacterized protein n=1 Tax=Mycena albidolilacea TaxID=1033008 RepID=A0AAD7AHM6_9AGAR|nr:hypothetical protein DFH08DRAFT_845389 [Mycena albidolilacea]